MCPGSSQQRPCDRRKQLEPRRSGIGQEAAAVELQRQHIVCQQRKPAREKCGPERRLAVPQSPRNAIAEPSTTTAVACSGSYPNDSRENDSTCPSRYVVSTWRVACSSGRNRSCARQAPRGTRRASPSAGRWSRRCSLTHSNQSRGVAESRASDARLREPGRGGRMSIEHQACDASERGDRQAGNRTRG